MAVLWFEEDFEQDDRITDEDYDFTRHFKAKVTDQDDGSLTLLDARPDLAPGQPHPVASAARVVSFDPVRRDDSLVYTIRVGYSLFAEDEPDNPLQKAAEITLTSQQRSVATLRDSEGNWQTNTAGQLLDPDEDEIPEWIVNVSKRVAPNLPIWIMFYESAVNNDPFHVAGISWPAESLRLKGMRVSKVERGKDGTLYVTLSFGLHYRREGWFTFRPNVGTEELIEIDDLGTFLVPIYENVKLGLVKSVVELVNKGNDELSATEIKNKEEYLEGIVPTWNRVSEAQFLDEDGSTFRNAEGLLRAPTASEIRTIKVKKGVRLAFSQLYPLTQ